MNKSVTVANRLRTEADHEARSKVTLSTYKDSMAPMDRLSTGSEGLENLPWEDVSERQDASVLSCVGELAGLRVKMTAIAVDMLDPGNIKEKEARVSTVMLRDAITQHAEGKPETFKLHVDIGSEGRLAVLEREYVLIVSPRKVVEDVPTSKDADTGPETGT